ncbi:hypothetical protein EEL30_21980 [Brevibacillus laterosporus]|uniref:Uncharacterized protein n=1 Tax=Brevibacillus laterosporus TaxID=1465 RepID=A0A518VCJ4_BRELA|nr:hypothetical protein EEL30_21980 [Brevibacillus laterosporus]
MFLLVLYFTFIGFILGITITAGLSNIVEQYYKKFNSTATLLFCTFIILILFFLLILIGKGISNFLQDSKLALFISNSLLLISYEIFGLFNIQVNVHSILFPTFFSSLVAMSYIEYMLTFKNKSKTSETTV